MAFCTKCGATVQGPFCGNCGAPAGSAAGGAPAAAPGPAAPPPSAAPPAPAAAPAAPATVAKTSPVVWIVAGCGGLIVLMALAGGLAFYYLAHKARQVAHGIERNPALAITRMLAAANPDVDVVSVDEGRGTITVRDKKTGKTMTMNFQDAQKGKFVFEQDGQKLNVEAHADGDKGSLELKSSEGSLKFGAGTGKMPDWLPAYPGSDAKGVMSMQNAKENSGTFQFTTQDSVEQVVRYYEDALKKAGLKVNTNTVQQDGKTGLGILTAEGSNRKAVVNATATGEGTNVGITYTVQP